MNAQTIQYLTDSAFRYGPFFFSVLFVGVPDSLGLHEVQHCD